jgi:hypothetical protein
MLGLKISNQSPKSTPPLDPHLVDSFGVENWGYSFYLRAIDYAGYFQGVTGDGSQLYSAKFYLNKIGSPAGNLIARLYEHSGSWGVDGKPTGAALAESSPIPSASVSATKTLYEFFFPSGLTLVNGTHYCIALETDGGDNSNYIEFGFKDGASGHPGTAGYKQSGIWNVYPAECIFYLNGV